MKDVWRNVAPGQNQDGWLCQVCKTYQ